MSGVPVPQGVLITLIVAALGLSLALVIGAAYAVGLAVEAVSGGTLSVGIASVLFAFGMFLAAAGAHRVWRSRGELPFLLTNVAAVVACLGLVLWYLRAYVSYWWFGAASALVIAIHLGSFAFARHRRRTLARLLRNTSESYQPPEAITAFERQFSDHSLIYIAVPAGAVAGALVAIVGDFEPQAALRLVVALIASFALLGMCWFLFLGARRIQEPFVEEDRQTDKATLRPGGGSITVLIPAYTDARPDRAAIDGAVMAADIRKLFLYNQYQQLVVLIAIASILVSVTVGSVNMTAIVVLSLATAVFAAQLPFMVGQRRDYDCVLEPYDGVKREEIRETLAKYCPIFPKSESFVALSASGTAGGIAVKVFEKALQDLLL